MTGVRLKDIPKLERGGRNLDQFADSVQEAVQTFRGTRGDPLDKALTRRDAIGYGLLAPGGAGTGPGGGGLVVPPGIGGGPPYVIDLTPPPTPTVTSVTAGITNIYIELVAPTYLQGHGHKKTNFYGAKRPAAAPPKVFTDAILIGEAFDARTIYVHPTEPATRWAIWVTFTTNDGVESVTPAGGANGFEATTGQDVALLLQALTGQITESQLYSALGDRINLIDGAGPGSVNARVASEASTRSTADSALASSISTVSATAASNTAAISTEATARATADGQLFAQYTVKLDVNGYVSGFGLASTSSGAAPFSSFIIRADSFAISSPSGPGITPITPFIVRTTSGSVNGVSYPAGVYIDAAYILDLTAAIARLGTAWIDDAKIGNVSAGKLTVGDGTIGGNLKSSNYSAGSAGWLLQPNGNAEFGFAAIRGTLLAGQIGANYITTLMLAANSVTTTQLAAGSVTASKISVTSLDAVSATIGLLRTATSGARQEIASNYIKVFDASNVKRVQLGDLSA